MGLAPSRAGVGRDRNPDLPKRIVGRVSSNGVCPGPDGRTTTGHLAGESDGRDTGGPRAGHGQGRLAYSNLPRGEMVSSDRKEEVGYRVS